MRSFPVTTSVVQSHHVVAPNREVASLIAIAMSNKVKKPEIDTAVDHGDPSISFIDMIQGVADYEDALAELLKDGDFKAWLATKPFEDESVSYVSNGECWTSFTPCGVNSDETEMLDALDYDADSPDDGHTVGPDVIPGQECMRLVLAFYASRTGDTKYNSMCHSELVRSLFEPYVGKRVFVVDLEYCDKEGDVQYRKVDAVMTLTLGGTKTKKKLVLSKKGLSIDFTSIDLHSLTCKPSKN